MFQDTDPKQIWSPNKTNLNYFVDGMPTPNENP